jgi:hypothetical protein
MCTPRYRYHCGYLRRQNSQQPLPIPHPGCGRCSTGMEAPRADAPCHRPDGNGSYGLSPVSCAMGDAYDSEATFSRLRMPAVPASSAKCGPRAKAIEKREHCRSPGRCRGHWSPGGQRATARASSRSSYWAVLLSRAKYPSHCSSLNWYPSLVRSAREGGSRSMRRP